MQRGAKSFDRRGTLHLCKTRLNRHRRRGKKETPVASPFRRHCIVDVKKIRKHGAWRIAVDQFCLTGVVQFRIIIKGVWKSLDKLKDE